MEILSGLLALQYGESTFSADSLDFQQLSYVCNFADIAWAFIWCVYRLTQAAHAVISVLIDLLKPQTLSFSMHVGFQEIHVQ